MEKGNSVCQWERDIVFVQWKRDIVFVSGKGTKCLLVEKDNSVCQWKMEFG